jgi:hypothetical protein
VADLVAGRQRSTRKLPTSVFDTLTGGKLSNEPKSVKKTDKLNGNSHA